VAVGVPPDGDDAAPPSEACATWERVDKPSIANARAEKRVSPASADLLW
jgi:hypothetical protein